MCHVLRRYFMQAWDKGFSFEAQEAPEGCWLEVTHGALPRELEGTFFRCATTGQVGGRGQRCWAWLSYKPCGSV